MKLTKFPLYETAPTMLVERHKKWYRFVSILILNL